MQPITQGSLDPSLNYIRHLRADQLFHRVMGCFIEIRSKVEEKYLLPRSKPTTETPLISPPPLPPEIPGSSKYPQPDPSS
jgi:hypothetical protein